MIEQPIPIARIRKNQREEIRVQLDSFRGTDLLDVRVTFAHGQSGEQRATSKGIAIRVDLLPAFVEAIQAARIEAERLGLI
jgi:hypothetical protein